MAEGLSDTVDCHSPYRWVLLGGLWLVYFSFGMVASSLAPFIPEVRADLELTNAEIGLVLGAWPLIYVITALPCGILLDQVEARTGLLLGALAVALSAALRGFSDGGVMLFAGTAVLGIGGPLISAGAPKYAATWFGEDERGLAFGLYATAPACGAAVAFWMPAQGLLDFVGGDWHDFMAINALVAVLAGAIAFLLASHPHFRIRHEPGSSGSIQLRSIKRLLGTPRVRRFLLVGMGLFFINHGLNNWLAVILHAQGLNLNDVGTWSALSMLAGVFGLIILPRTATPQNAQRVLFIVLVLTAVSLFSLTVLSGGWSVASVLALGFLRTPATAIALFVTMSHPSIEAEDKGKMGCFFFFPD